MVKVTGKGFISASIIAHSKHASTGVELITYELEYPRFIHAEFMTHRMLSKNAASSRAIPVKAALNHIMQVPQGPIHWGKNQSSMQAKEELSGLPLESAIGVWDAARRSAVNHATVLSQIGLHKQAANRIAEPFTQMKVVCSGTEWNNFFWLRNHEDAQPEIKELARVMLEAKQISKAVQLNIGEWHLPYINTKNHDHLEYWSGDRPVTLDEAKKISASCCAQVSYRKNDTSIEKAVDIFDKLINSSPVHASPVEHQATPIDLDQISLTCPDRWEELGATHIRADGSVWCNNFRNWTQLRHFIKENTKW